MKHKVLWTNKAQKQIYKLQIKMQNKIFSSVLGLEQDEKEWVNVKKLINHKYDYRLRVGDYRVLFNSEITIEIISIEEVKKRDDRTY